MNESFFFFLLLRCKVTNERGPKRQKRHDERLIFKTKSNLAFQWRRKNKGKEEEKREKEKKRKKKNGIISRETETIKLTQSRVSARSSVAMFQWFHARIYRLRQEKNSANIALNSKIYIYVKRSNAFRWRKIKTYGTMNTQKQEQKYHYSNSYFIPSPYFFSSLFVVSLHNWDYSFKNFVYTEIRCSRNFRFSSSPPPPSNEILQNISLIAVSFRVAESNHTHWLSFDFAFLWTIFFFFFIYRILTSKKFTRKSIDFSYNKKSSYGDKFNLRVCSLVVDPR